MMKSQIGNDPAWGSREKNSGVDSSWYGTERRPDHMPTQPKIQESAESAQDRRAFRFVGFIFAPLGAIFLIVAAANAYFYMARSITVSADIVDVVERSDDDGTTYAPTYHYIYDDKEYTVTPNDSSSRYPKIGSEEMIHIDKDDPGKIHTLTLTLIFGIMGSVFFFLGIVILIPGRDTKTRSQSGN